MLKAVLSLALFLTAPALNAGIVTDIEGRQVEITGPVRRVVLSDFRQVIGLSLVDQGLGAKLVGAGSKSRVGPELAAELDRHFPGILEIPELAENAPTLSAEKVIVLEPDLVILSEPPGPSVNQLVAQLEHANIPSIFVDFRINPFENTLPSLRIAAQALGVEPPDFLAYYAQHRSAVTERAARLSSDRPLVLMHLQATPRAACCMSLGNISLGPFIDAAGGRNLGADVVPGAFAQISAEFVLARQPDIYIATGGRQLEQDGGLVVGPGISSDLAEQSLQNLVTSPILSDISAIQQGKAYGLWHSIHNSPLNIVALEILAKWFHPEAFAELDPQQTLNDINARFLPFTFDGAIWVELE